SNSVSIESNDAALKPPVGAVTSCTMMPCVPTVFTTARCVVNVWHAFVAFALGTLNVNVSPTLGTLSARTRPVLRRRNADAARIAPAFSSNTRRSIARMRPSAIELYMPPAAGDWAAADRRRSPAATSADVGAVTARSYDPITSGSVSALPATTRNVPDWPFVVANATQSSAVGFVTAWTPPTSRVAVVLTAPLGHGVVPRFGCVVEEPHAVAAAIAAITA